MEKQVHVFGGFKTPEGAHRAVERLVEVGVPRDTISALLTAEARSHLATVQKRTRGLEGAAGGGIVGGVLGGLVAAVGTVSAGIVPGLGLVAAGPIVATLAGAGAGAATGGTLGAVVGLGMLERKLKVYTEILESDGVLVSVSTDDRRICRLAQRTLEEMGATRLETTRGTTAHV